MALLHENLTKKIIGACFEVMNELGEGFLESVYEKALIIALKDLGIGAKRQVPLKVRFRGQVVGYFFADLLVEEKVIVEMKAVQALIKAHSAQVINYLKGADIDVGLLINFGKAIVEHKYLEHPKHYRKEQPQISS